MNIGNILPQLSFHPMLFMGELLRQHKEMAELKDIGNVYGGTKEGRREGNYTKPCLENTKYKLLKLIILFVSQTFPITFCLLLTEY